MAISYVKFNSRGSGSPRKLPSRAHRIPLNYKHGNLDCMYKRTHLLCDVAVGIGGMSLPWFIRWSIARQPRNLWCHLPLTPFPFVPSLSSQTTMKGGSCDALRPENYSFYYLLVVIDSRGRATATAEQSHLLMNNIYSPPTEPSLFRCANMKLFKSSVNQFQIRIMLNHPMCELVSPG